MLNDLTADEHWLLDFLVQNKTCVFEHSVGPEKSEIALYKLLGKGLIWPTFVARDLILASEYKITDQGRFVAKLLGEPEHNGDMMIEGWF